MEGSCRPSMTRKRSGLDYDQDLALPMPKPRHPKPEPFVNIMPPSGAENLKPQPHLLKKRSMTDTAYSKASPACEPVTSGDGKKKSRLDLIKLKLSFKDLRKESVKDDGANTIPHVPFIQTKSGLHRPSASSGISAFSPSTYALKTESKPVETGTSSPSNVASAIFTPQANSAPSRIPLPPSGTHAHAQMATSRSSTGRQVSSWGQVKATAELGETQEKLGAATKGIKVNTAQPSETRQPNIVVSRPSLDTPAKNRESSTSKPHVPKYAPTGDLPIMIGELTEGTGRVSYLPKDWLEGTSPLSPSPTIKTKRHSETMHSNDELPVTSQPDYMPSFIERLDDANLPNDKTTAEIRNHRTATHVDDVVEMVWSIQRQADSGISSLNKKLEELSLWIGDHLRNQIETVSDLNRANNEISSRQYELSRDLMKFHLDIRLETGVMERRMNVFEMKLLDELQTEIRNLAASYDELHMKTAYLVEKYSSDATQKFIKDQRQKNVEIDNEIAYLKEQREANLKAIWPLQAQPCVSQSTIASTELLIRPPVSASPPLPMPQSVPTTPSRPKLPPAAKSKASNVFSRSLSFKRGLTKVISGTSDCENKNHGPTGSTEDTKKWNVFNFRRRHRTTSQGSTSPGKFSWAYSRRSKDGAASDNGSSRSTTPPPPIPRNVLQNIESNIHAASKVHPAFRNVVQQSCMKDKSLVSPIAPVHTSIMSPLMTRLSHHDGQNSSIVSASMTPSPASSQDNKASNGEIPSPDKYEAQELLVQDSESLTPLRPIEGMRKPLLGEAEEEDHAWDRVSLHEAKTTEYLQ
ncbi:uncharacterized protein N7482_006608 [Penicillium canariense]|uniref:Uncharacterized protein n=1 Tax=Penicillium canariense TaxID=189055 RepID=A0A9W9LJB4_9EURO|nr:uncharacterized protein N7482_006608 [Penicillium canariense]KAJ5159604.1 hypothetical protein N7482_006608 [Penicillium canariense]